MLRLVVIFLLGSLVWMCWWAFGQVAYEKGLTLWVDDRRADGWAADYSSLETRGFPNRFDTTIRDIALADPDTGVAWSAPFVQFLSLSYKPHQLIAVLPERHTFSTPLQTINLTHEDARASIFLKPSTALELDRLVFVTSTLEAKSSKGDDLRLKDGRLAAEAVPDEQNTYRIGWEFNGLLPTKEMRKNLDPGGILPEVVDNLRADAVVTFDAPWDRSAIEDQRPQITALDLTDLSARWGDINFRAVGALTVDELGIPAGQITVRAEKWRQVLDMAVAVGAIPGSLQGTLETALGLFAGPGDVLDAPLNFEDGRVSLGLIPLGDAPQLVLR